MKITIEVDCSHPTFGETAVSRGERMRDVLYKLGEDLAAEGVEPQRLGVYDPDGNRVGACTVTES